MFLVDVDIRAVMFFYTICLLRVSVLKKLKSDMRTGYNYQLLTSLQHSWIQLQEHMLQVRNMVDKKKTKIINASYKFP
jgi:hypothetical protein